MNHETDILNNQNNEYQKKENLEETIDTIKIIKRFKIFSQHPILIPWLGIYILITLYNLSLNLTDYQ
jgi:hypothetical protein